MGMTDRSVLSPLMSARPIWRQVLYLAWPALGQQALLLCVGLWDRFLAGVHVPDDSASHVAYQAAQSNASYFVWFLSSYSVLASVGSTALIARFTGAGDRNLAQRTLHQSILLAAVLGIIGGIAGLVLSGPVISLVGSHGETAQFTVAFLRPLFFMLVFQVIETTGIACLVGAGDTRTGLIITAGVALLNMPMSWIMFRGIGTFTGFGFVGIAMGTAGSHFVGGIAVLLVLLSGRNGLQLRLAELRPDFSLLYRLLRVSLPAAFDSFSVIVGQFLFLSIVNRLSTDAIAANGLAIQWEALGYLTAQAFGVAAITLVGQYLGAARPHDAARSGWTALAVGGGLVCLMGVVFFILAPQMFRLFCPHDHQRNVVTLGVQVLRLVAFAMPALACTNILTSALRGAGDTRWPVLFTWIGFLGVRIPLAAWMTSDSFPGGNLGLLGAWLAMFADLYVRGLFFFFRFASGRWKNIRV
jgi:putative MATE family efflux protein